MSAPAQGASVALDSITASIDIFGPNILIPIVKTDDGEIIDGSLRLQALDALGLPSDSIPSVVIDSSEASLLQLQLNVFRRHLSKSQLALMGVDFEQSGPKAAKLLGAVLRPDDNGHTSAPLGRLYGVSRRMIELARRLVREAPAAVVDEVRAGTLTINAALKALAGGDDPPEEIHTNVRWTTLHHGQLQAGAARSRASQSDYLGQLVAYAHTHPEVAEVIYQRLNPGDQPWIPSVEELAILTAPINPEETPLHSDAAPVLAPPPVRSSGSTKMVPYARPHKRSLESPIKKELNNIIFKELLPPGTLGSPNDTVHAPVGARTGAARAMNGPMTLAVTEELIWTPELVVERYNDAVAEWSKRNPGPHGGKGLRPISRLTPNTLSDIETLRVSVEGDLDRLYGYLGDIPQLSPEVIIASHRHTLHMMVRPTRSHPEIPFLLRIAHYRDWTPTASAVQPTPTPALTPPTTPTHAPKDEPTPVVTLPAEQPTGSSYDVEGFDEREAQWVQRASTPRRERPPLRTRPPAPPMESGEAACMDEDGRWMRKGSHIADALRAMGFEPGR